MLDMLISHFLMNLIGIRRNNSVISFSGPQKAAAAEERGLRAKKGLLQSARESKALPNGDVIETYT